MIPSETIPCEACGTPTPFTGTRRCNNCWEVERRLPEYLKSPKAWDFVRQHIPKLDDWVDGHPDARDYDTVLREKEVIVEWCDTLVDGNGNEHRAGEFAGWGFYWKHGAIHIGQCSERIARKAAALFVSLWLRGVSASFCDKLMDGFIVFLERQENTSLTFLTSRDGQHSAFGFRLTRASMMDRQPFDWRTQEQIIEALDQQPDEEITVTFTKRKRHDSH